MGTLSKILTTGVGAAFMTESGIRSALSEIKLTQQAIDYLSRHAQKGREELTKVLSGEFKKFLEHIDLRGELESILKEMTIEVEAKIRLVPPDGRKKTSSRGRSRLELREFRKSVRIKKT